MLQKAHSKDKNEPGPFRLLKKSDNFPPMREAMMFPMAMGIKSNPTSNEFSSKACCVLVVITKFKRANCAMDKERTKAIQVTFTCEKSWNGRIQFTKEQ